MVLVHTCVSLPEGIWLVYYYQNILYSYEQRLLFGSMESSIGAYPGLPKTSQLGMIKYDHTQYITDIQWPFQEPKLQVPTM